MEWFIIKDIRIYGYGHFISGASKMSCEECWITMAEDDRGATCAMVLAKSLRRVATTRKIAVVVCDGVSEDYRYFKYALKYV